MAIVHVHEYDRKSLLMRIFVLWQQFCGDPSVLDPFSVIFWVMCVLDPFFGPLFWVMCVLDPQGSPQNCRHNTKILISKDLRSYS